MIAIELHPILLYSLGVACGAGFLACGMLLGDLWVKGRAARPASDSLASTQLEQLVHLQLRWTSALAGDVHQCHNQLAEIGRDVLESCGERPPAPEEFVQLMSQMIQANGQMRQRLTIAEEALAQQAGRIARSLNEARTDALTNLPNRRLFDEDLARRKSALDRYHNGFSLLLIDLDRFKVLNDTHGHLAGDEVLKCVSRAIGQTLRESDLLARYGGEEFAVLLAQSAGRDVQSAAERIRKAVSECAPRFDDKLMNVTVSCGLAEASRGEPTEALVRRSDEALYAAKNAGRNRVFINDGRICSPLDSEVKVSDSAATAFLQHEDEEVDLADACNALRARLLEVTSGCK